MDYVLGKLNLGRSMNLLDIGRGRGSVDKAAKKYGVRGMGICYQRPGTEGIDSKNQIHHET